MPTYFAMVFLGMGLFGVGEDEHSVEFIRLSNEANLAFPSKQLLRLWTVYMA
jgi:hypothetical protein